MIVPALARAIRRGLLLVMGGLAIQLACALFFSPGAFVMSAVIGLPLVVLGAALFARAALRVVPPPQVQAGDGSKGAPAP